MKKDYIFKSERLGFRNWNDSDLDEFANLNADLDVMEYFPKPLTRTETSDFIKRLRTHYETFGYSYFATDIIETGELIGFIGLAYQEYKTEFTPATDIGWRLKKSAWGNGYATEGAKKCLEFAFKNLNIESVISVFTEKNIKSESIMKKIGMVKIGTFNHPKLKAFPQYEKCICYKIDKDSWLKLT
ncbi:GNAT family N-acetyltransferase [Psychroserpens sp.]|uniref:GNAT family N-acetyltransferase n=1 Tax=Psychroserpens sp. TaxID=2020870 RepID=UPI002B275642|nr:GNAT family N-acetyltransferase [Psychroserpens sp.]